MAELAEGASPAKGVWGQKLHPEVQLSHRHLLSASVAQLDRVPRLLNWVVEVWILSDATMLILLNSTIKHTIIHSVKNQTNTAPVAQLDRVSATNRAVRGLNPLGAPFIKEPDKQPNYSPMILK